MFVLSDHLRGVLALDHEVDAVEFEGRWLTWGQLNDQVAAIRDRLADLGLGAENRVGIMIRNRPDSIAAILAALTLDACIVSINPLLPEERLNADLDKLKLPVVIGEADDFARPGVVPLLTAAGTAGVVLTPFLSGAALHPGLPAITGTDIVRDSPGTFVEMLTSGTTGTPKRIPLKRKNLIASITSALSMEKGRSADDPPMLRSGVELLGNPITHIGGLYFVVTTMASGRKMALQERFSVAGWHDAVKRHRPKVVGAVPAALRMILEADLPREDLSSLACIRSGTAPLDASVVDAFLERYDIPVLQSYGATEFAGAVAMWRLGDFREQWTRKRGSTGRMFPGTEGRIVDAETGAELPHGEEGVLELRARQIGDGQSWVRTTDRAVLDGDGYLFIRGRADNAIIRGGFKVHPDDVVKMVEAHPSVREAVVVGLPDERLGAVPVAAVMLKQGEPEPDEDELKAFVRERGLPYQVPVRFKIVDDVPRTPALKPALPLVRELFENDAASAA
ncbi:MAG: acyl--CoA ligase [Novosphingobium sp.]|nr:acyl--CoA ligase [Novosphingobium sp.]